MSIGRLHQLLAQLDITMDACDRKLPPRVLVGGVFESKEEFSRPVWLKAGKGGSYRYSYTRWNNQWEITEKETGRPPFNRWELIPKKGGEADPVVAQNWMSTAEDIRRIARRFRAEAEEEGRRVIEEGATVGSYLSILPRSAQSLAEEVRPFTLVKGWVEESYKLPSGTGTLVRLRVDPFGFCKWDATNLDAPLVKDMGLILFEAPQEFEVHTFILNEEDSVNVLMPPPLANTRQGLVDEYLAVATEFRDHVHALDEKANEWEREHASVIQHAEKIERYTTIIQELELGTIGGLIKGESEESALLRLFLEVMAGMVGAADFKDVKDILSSQALIMAGGPLTDFEKAILNKRQSLLLGKAPLPVRAVHAWSTWMRGKERDLPENR